jgi:hypothetical protein
MWPFGRVAIENETFGLIFGKIAPGPKFFERGVLAKIIIFRRNSKNFFEDKYLIPRKQSFLGIKDILRMKA